MPYKQPIRSKYDFSKVKVRLQSDWTNRIVDSNVLSRTAASPRLRWSFTDAVPKRRKKYERLEQTISHVDTVDLETTHGLDFKTQLFFRHVIFRRYCLDEENPYMR